MTTVNYTPQNDQNTLYIRTGFGVDMADTLNRFVDHFGPGVAFENFEMRAEYIHTRCLTYDQYDPSDYDNYIVFERKIPR